MKVITVGATSQSRVAQACDRCRSKKIRCDGIRPCCSQCATVGFECRTSDKLSRRAFPRGYTESLEERVRALEAEVRGLKDALDEKDDVIDLLHRMRKQSPSTSVYRSLPLRSAISSNPISPRTIPTTTQTTFQEPPPVSPLRFHPLISPQHSISPAFKDEPRSADDSPSKDIGRKQLRPSRKRFHSPFSEYPRLDSDIENESQQTRASKGRRSMARLSHMSSVSSSIPQVSQQHRPPPLQLKPQNLPNLDYFPLAESNTYPPSPSAPVHAPSHVSPAEWEHLICAGNLHEGADSAHLYSSTMSMGWMGNEPAIDIAHRPSQTHSAFSSLSEGSFTSGAEEQGISGRNVQPYGGYAVAARASDDTEFVGFSGLEAEFSI